MHKMSSIAFECLSEGAHSDLSWEKDSGGSQGHTAQILGHWLDIPFCKVGQFIACPVFHPAHKIKG